MSLPAAKADIDPVFVLREPPAQSAPFVFGVPHAGNRYPKSFLRASPLAPAALRRSEDAFVDRLFEDVIGLGAPLISACFPRAFLDVNREPFELDPSMFDGPLPACANPRSMRVAGGLGTIPKIVANGHEIYRGKIGVEEGLRRIETLYWPYHRALEGLLDRTEGRFGHAVLIDCHSMPSATHPREEAAKADVVLGDRFGTSCAAELVDLVDLCFRERGFTVVRNKPYAGGFITEHYGVPSLGRHALQVELNRALYMDEREIRPLPSFPALATEIAGIFDEVIREIGCDLAPLRMAAE